MRKNYGSWALVAGASDGLGAEFARQLARKGLNLVLIARRGELLEKLSNELHSSNGIQVRPLVQDLADENLLTYIRQETSDIEVGMLVYNAAHSRIGAFIDQSLDNHLATINVNCRAPLLLAHEFGQKMRARRNGGIILMSSMSGLQGSALVASYAASKAFNLILGESLWEELRSSGVDVLACCAGATRTPAYLATNPQNPGVLSAPLMDPPAVVKEALDSLGKTPSIVPGLANRVATFFMARLLPRQLAIKTIGKTLKSMYPGHL
jgi:uncharacterized protein